MRRGEAVDGMERLIGQALIVGVMIAALVVLLGAAVYLLHHAGEPVHYRIFRGEPGDLRHLGGILRDTWEGTGRGLIQLGLVILVVLQLVRVALTALLFARARDWLYVAFSIFILLTLSYSLSV